MSSAHRQLSRDSVSHFKVWIYEKLLVIMNISEENTVDGLAPLDARIWWRHQMEIFSALLAICAGNSPVPGEFPAQRPVTRSFDVFFDLRFNKRLSKQSWGWWFETLSRPFWCHCSDIYPLAHAIVIKGSRTCIRPALEWLTILFTFYISTEFT